MLIFETHATSLDNEAGLASGWYDVDLSARGEQQARQVGERYALRDVSVVHCSDLRRAVRTAEIAFGTRGTRIVQDARLRECDYGAMSRRPTSAIDERRVACIDTPFPGGESYQDVVRRTQSWLDDVCSAVDSTTVIVIGHRATWYALEHLCAGRSLRDAITGAWKWQPGWSYRW